MAQFGSVWLSLAQLGSVWLSLAQLGSAWLRLKLDIAWLSIEFEIENSLILALSETVFLGLIVGLPFHLADCMHMYSYEDDKFDFLSRPIF